MLEKIDKCPVCFSDILSKYIVCKDHMLTGDSFAITKCDKCSFLFTNPRPGRNDLGKYYKSEEYISHSNKSNNLTNTLYKIARHFTLIQKVKFINKLTEDKTIFDYGCGTGEFLNACNKNGWKIFGLEPDDFARTQATDLTKSNIIDKIERLQSIENVSLITLWHVLEHIPELNTTFEILKSKLSNKGKFLIAVPNYKSYDAKLYNEHWAAFDVPRHLYHFSQETMKKFLGKHGLKIYSIKPMKLDSFYVSLLSEKYKSGKTNILKSFINGYKSNSYAKNNDNNFSSLIYIAGK